MPGLTAWEDEENPKERMREREKRKRPGAKMRCWCC